MSSGDCSYDVSVYTLVGYDSLKLLIIALFVRSMLGKNLP
jgi:hypothetical protein